MSDRNLSHKEANSVITWMGTFRYVALFNIGIIATGYFGNVPLITFFGVIGLMCAIYVLVSHQRLLNKNYDSKRD
jgi:hypothetical protein